MSSCFSSLLFSYDHNLYQGLGPGLPLINRISHDDGSGVADDATGHQLTCPPLNRDSINPDADDHHPMHIIISQNPEIMGSA